MHKRTHDAIARIAAGLGMRIDRADEESVIIGDGCGSAHGVYKTRRGWIIAWRGAAGDWRSDDAPRAYLKHNRGFNYFSAGSLDVLSDGTRRYGSAVSALRSLSRMVRGDS